MYSKRFRPVVALNVKARLTWLLLRDDSMSVPQTLLGSVRTKAIALRPRSLPDAPYYWGLLPELVKYSVKNEFCVNFLFTLKPLRGYGVAHYLL